MRSLLPGMIWMLALVGLPTSGVAWAQGAKDAPVAEDPAALLEQASASYEAGDFPAALVAARRSAELAPGKDSVLAYQIWLVSAEQVGDLAGMSAALDAYAKIPGLGKSSVAIIDKARPRLEFYQAEQAGRLDAAEAALARVRKVGASDPGWLKMAERRLALRKDLLQGHLDEMVKLTPAPTDSLGQQAWIRAVRGEAVAQASRQICKYEGGLVAVGEVLTLPYRTPDEVRRVSALQTRLRTEEAIADPGKGDPVVLSKALGSPNELSPEDRVWTARVATRAEMDADWAAGHYGEVLDLREHYRSLMDQAPVEPECLAPKVWLEADEVTWRAKEAVAIKEEEERKKQEEEDAKRREKRQASTGPTARQKKVSNWLFVGAGSSAAVAGMFGGVALYTGSMGEAWEASPPDYLSFHADGPSLLEWNDRSVVIAPLVAAGAAGLLSAAVLVRW